MAETENDCRNKWYGFFFSKPRMPQAYRWAIFRSVQQLVSIGIGAGASVGNVVTK